MKKLILLLLAIPLLLGTDYARKYPTNTPLEVVTPSSLPGLESDPLSWTKTGNQSSLSGTKSGTYNLDTDGTGSFGTLSLGSGSITDSSGAISFGDENISTTGTLGAGAITGTSLKATNLSSELVKVDASGNLVEAIAGTDYSRIIRGTFTNASLSSGVLTITHNWALPAPYTVSVTVFDNNYELVIAPLAGSTNSVTVDLITEGEISGTWGYLLTG